MCWSPLSQQISARDMQGSAAGGLLGAIPQQGGNDWTHIIIPVSSISGDSKDHFRLKKELECTYKGFFLNFGIPLQGLRGLQQQGLLTWGP